MGKKVQLRLLTSPMMSKKGEEALIRFPWKARQTFGFSPGSQVVIGKGRLAVTLHTKKAYREDIERLAKMIQEGRLSDKEAGTAGFVTQAVQRKVDGGVGKNVWVTGSSSNITIGCDPEFGLVDEAGTLHRGTTILPESENAKFGADGPGVEVRPAPARDHIALVEKIKDILENPPAEADRFQWVGGATFSDAHRDYWFGGHIHLGRPEGLKNDQAHQCYHKIATALDHLIALPLVSFDTPQPWKRREGCAHKYGLAGENAYRRIEVEGNDKFEYRVLSGLWLTHPTLALIVLGVTKCVTESAYRKAAEQHWDPEWIQAPASKPGLLHSLGIRRLNEVVSIINTARPQRLKVEHLKAWEKQLRGLEAYDKYSEEIGALVELVKDSPEKVVPKLRLDIRKNWQGKRALLPRASATTKRALERVEEKK